uniref:Uncharacterized protein n=1 Tax=Arundo donax TaxID=35708 RepID=A0A0A9AVK8_ARUDO
MSYAGTVSRAGASLGKKILFMYSSYTIY